MNVNWVTELLNLGTFVTGVIVLVSIIAYQTRYKKVFQDVYTKYYFQLGFFVSTLATLGSWCIAALCAMALAFRSSTRQMMSIQSISILRHCSRGSIQAFPTAASSKDARHSTPMPRLSACSGGSHNTPGGIIWLQGM